MNDLIQKTAHALKMSEHYYNQASRLASDLERLDPDLWGKEEWFELRAKIDDNNQSGDEWGNEWAKLCKMKNELALMDAAA